MMMAYELHRQLRILTGASPCCLTSLKTSWPSLITLSSGMPPSALAPLCWPLLFLHPSLAPRLPHKADKLAFPCQDLHRTHASPRLVSRGS
jgi:hypothetical protein